jgi:hypothetical protein
MYFHTHTQACGFPTKPIFVVWKESRLKKETTAVVIHYTLITVLSAGLRNNNKKPPE